MARDGREGHVPLVGVHLLADHQALGYGPSLDERHRQVDAVVAEAEHHTRVASTRPQRAVRVAAWGGSAGGIGAWQCHVGAV